MSRRATGSLEAEVLVALWASEDGATPREAHDTMGAGLAYTTVLTTMTRLWGKGLVDRVPEGRAFRYRPKVTEAELAAQRMRTHLERAGDREAALSSFVGTLGKKDAQALRRIVERSSEER